MPVGRKEFPSAITRKLDEKLSRMCNNIVFVAKSNYISSVTGESIGYAFLARKNIPKDTEIINYLRSTKLEILLVEEVTVFTIMLIPF